jgi:hypothetical protein
MNENEIGHAKESENTPVDPGRSTRQLWVAMIVILCLAAVAVGFIVDQHKVANQLSARNQELTTSLTQTKGQLEGLSAQLNTLKFQEAAREQAALEQRHRAALARAQYLRRHAVKKDDPRWKQVEAELAEHQKAIDAAQQNLQQTRTDLQNNLSSTRDELNGSIAKTHDELVALERKGERNYYEFDIYKNKQFQRVGPIAVSLRKTNAKHQFCSLHLLVDDKDLTKKQVNIYEPVVFYTEQNGRPMELVINNISKNHMHGYLSTPKYSATAVSATNNAPNQAAAGAPANLEHRPDSVR